MELFGLCWWYPWRRHLMCSPGALRARRAGHSSPKAAARRSHHAQSTWQRLSPCCHMKCHCSGCSSRHWAHWDAVCLPESPSAFYRSSWLSWSGAWGRGLSFSSCMTQGCQEQLESPLMSISAVTHHCCRRHWFPKRDSLVLNSILAKTAWHSLYITSRQVSSGFNSLLSRTFQCLKNLCWDFLIFQTLISERLGDKNPQETKISTASRHLCTYSAIYSQRTSGTQHHRVFWLGAHTGFAEQFCNKNYSTAVFFTCGACQVQAQDSKQFTWASPGCDSGSLSIASSSRENIHPSSLPASSVSMQNQNKLLY